MIAIERKKQPEPLMKNTKLKSRFLPETRLSELDEETASKLEQVLDMAVAYAYSYDKLARDADPSVDTLRAQVMKESASEISTSLIPFIRPIPGEIPNAVVYDGSPLISNVVPLLRKAFHIAHKFLAHGNHGYKLSEVGSDSAAITRLFHEITGELLYDK